MMRGLALIGTALLAGLPLAIAPLAPVGWIGLIAVLLVLVGISIGGQWAVTAAACILLVEYTLSLSLSGPPVDFVQALAFGLILLMVLQSADFARRVGSAAIDRAARRAHLRRWLTVGAGTLAATVSALAIAGLVGAALPPAAAPVGAALGGFGVLLALAGLVRRAAREGTER
jgi:hypothetical protein